MSARYSHGIASTEDGELGLYQSWENDDKVNIITAMDADGNVIDYAPITREISVRIELILDLLKTLPVAGSVITLTDTHVGSNRKVVVENVVSSMSNTDFKRATINAKRWPTLNVPV